MQWRKLDIPGIDRLQGAGVYYGAGSTEALSCRDEDVYIVGGANSAGQAAMNFARYAQNVIMLVRGDEPGRNHVAIPDRRYRADAQHRVEYGTEVVAVHGEDKLEAISIACARTGTVEQRRRPIRLFVFIGAEPRTDWLEGFVERDNRGFVLTGPDLMPRRQTARRAGPRTATPSCWKPACPASSRWAMSATAPSNASLPAWAKAPSPFSSFTAIWRRS